MEGLANAAGHEDRHTPLKNYCKGLLLPIGRKSIEPMAAVLDHANVQPMRQSLHQFVAKAPWSDEAVLEQVRSQVMPAMEKDGPVVAWIVDDTGFPKKGKHSVGVARQYCAKAKMRTGRQTGKLPRGGQPLAGDLERKSADRVSLVPAEGVDRRCQAARNGRSSRGDRISNQAGNRVAADPYRGRGRDSARGCAG
jgi:hypothetical protein